MRHGDNGGQIQTVFIDPFTVFFFSNSDPVSNQRFIQEATKAATRLPRVIFKHIRREQNQVAYALAQLGRRLQHSAIWHSRFPFCIEQASSSEM